MSPRRASLVLAALLLGACGVRGAPAVPPPLFGETDLPPVVPQPYQSEVTQSVDTLFAPTLGGYEISEDFPETLPEDRSIRAAAPRQVETAADGEENPDPAE